MKSEHVFLTANGHGLSRAENVAGHWEVSHLLEGVRINCMVSDPANPQKIFLGTQANGILVSNDAGQSWQPVGLYQIPIKSIAVDPSDPQTIYAGGKPVSLFVSHDGGGCLGRAPRHAKDAAVLVVLTSGSSRHKTLC